MCRAKGWSGLLAGGQLFAEVSLTHAPAALSATSVDVMGQLYQVERRARLVEPDGWLIVLLVLGSLAWIAGLDRWRWCSFIAEFPGKVTAPTRRMRLYNRERRGNVSARESLGCGR